VLDAIWRIVLFHHDEVFTWLRNRKFNNFRLVLFNPQGFVHHHPSSSNMKLSFLAFEPSIKAYIPANKKEMSFLTQDILSIAL